MPCISITYALFYRFKVSHHHQVTKDGKVFNTQTGRQLNRCYNNRCVGYWINGKFVSIKSGDALEKIPSKNIYPF